MFRFFRIGLMMIEGIELKEVRFLFEDSRLEFRFV